MHTRSSLQNDTENSSKSGCIPFRISRDIQDNIIRPVKAEIHTHIQRIRQESKSLDDLIQKLRNAYGKLGACFYAQNPEEVVDVVLALKTERETTRWPDFSVMYSPIVKDESSRLSGIQQAFVYEYRSFINDHLEAILNMEEYFLGEQIVQEAKNIEYWKHALSDVENSHAELEHIRNERISLDGDYAKLCFDVLGSWQKLRRMCPVPTSSELYAILFTNMVELGKTYTKIDTDALHQYKQLLKKICLEKHLSHWKIVSGDAQKSIIERYASTHNSLLGRK